MKLKKEKRRHIGYGINKKKKLAIILGTTIPLFFILLFVSIPIIYVSDYYHADEEAIEAFVKEYDIERKELDKNLTAFIPDTYEHGFIFILVVK